MERRLDDMTLERSPVVANCAMNRERTLRSYGRELGIDVLTELGGAWLDLCCGAGRALAEAAGQRPDARITGVDLTGHFLPAARAVRLVTASVAEWAPDEPYDLITCVHGLHYVGDKLRVLARAARISLRGRREVRLPYRYLGADDQAGPNYTGQPAVDSFYAPIL
ncbi:class I SAM-dependent methyltransferase [Actinomadura sp. NPDC048394]|uniref:class I SAM-dependent methyltransferase n=1 Tax=Actinomadura sp. NPDC048394 TaxID=3158223 RepID=UPI0033EBB1E4